ncbi:hypothetical protein EI94DRAFT_1698379 [Lactarius quietus]|nr:hypothetical protein EI94DRAFT_1698379 [Lactarius quietus]
MSSNKQAIIRHPRYFLPDGDVIIKVEDTMFRVHKYFLTRESKMFRSMFHGVTTVPCRDPPGSSETNPVVLKATNTQQTTYKPNVLVTSEGFSDLLWVFYNPEYSVYTATIDKWQRILDLAQLWDFIQVERLCVRELEKLSIPPVEKIQIYQYFKIDPNLLHGSYVALTTRAEPLDTDEGEKLGLSTSLNIARARELARSPGATDLFGSTTARLQESEVELVVRNVFGLQESASAQPPPQPTSAAKQNQTNEELVEKATGKNKKNNKT